MLSDDGFRNIGDCLPLLAPPSSQFTFMEDVFADNNSTMVAKCMIRNINFNEIVKVKYVTYFINFSPLGQSSCLYWVQDITTRHA